MPMKVISQLVKHFWQRGALTASDADYLVDHGFIRADELAGYPGQTGHSEQTTTAKCVKTLDQADVAEVDRLHSAEQLEVALLRRRPTRGKKRGAPQLKSISLDQLCRRLNDEFQRRGASLTFLADLAVRFGPVGDWQAAAASLRRTSDQGFSDSLAGALRRGRKLSDAWQAVDVEPFHRLLADDEVRGRAARAFSALLLTDDTASLGKYAWILKRDEMQVVLNLQSARRRLLVTLNDFYHHRRRLLTSALERGSEPVAVWALVLLHNANRAGLAANSGGRLSDYGPVDPPANDVWQQAWTTALVMDRSRVMRLLISCYMDGGERGARSPDAIDRPLYCPVGWHLPSEVRRGA
jgi:hypothetical protein